MLSKRPGAVAIILGCLASSCSLPWSGDASREINLSFRWKNNLVLVNGTVDSKPAKFIVGTAQSRSVLDRKFSDRGGQSVRIVLGDRYSKTVSPVAEDLKGVADGILGADVWDRSTLTLDYFRQLAIVSAEASDNLEGTLYRFDGPPSIPVTIDGRREVAVVDTALPDSLILPSGGRSGRMKAQVRVGEFDLGELDVAIAETSTPRIGNRILSQFMVKIDYGRGAIWLWRDPRRP